MKKRSYHIMLNLFCAAIVLSMIGCNREYMIAIPSMGSHSILQGTLPLENASKQLLEGIYSVTASSGNFKDTMVVKWNRSSLSLACRNGNYFVMNAGSINSDIFLEGYWRDAYGDATGLCTLTLAGNEGGKEILHNTAAQKIILRGSFSNGETEPNQNITLTYLRSFSSKVKNSQFKILAHRGGGRTSDKLPVSENSIEMLNWTERLGSTGVELDVRLTRDKVAFLYHDPDINIRLTQKGPLSGEIKAYSWQELNTHVRLIHGEKIPSLESALTFLIDSTRLSFAYLDMKEDHEAMAVVIPIQQKMLQYAREKGREVTMVVGIPSEAVLNDFMTYPGFQSVPSLCELSVANLMSANSAVWAPRWTLGTQNELVGQVHQAGKLAICWTIDNPAWIKEFTNNGQFDGFLSNYPTVVTYFHYLQQ